MIKRFVNLCANNIESTKIEPVRFKEPQNKKENDRALINK